MKAAKNGMDGNGGVGPYEERAVIIWKVPIFPLSSSHNLSGKGVVWQPSLLYAEEMFWAKYQRR